MNNLPLSWGRGVKWEARRAARAGSPTVSIRDAKAPGGRPRWRTREAEGRGRGRFGSVGAERGAAMKRVARSGGGERDRFKDVRSEASLGVGAPDPTPETVLLLFSFPSAPPPPLPPPTVPLPLLKLLIFFT